MNGITALLDANILYSAPVADVFMQLAVMDLFRAKWTADIHAEWIKAVLRNKPHLERARLERRRDLMDMHVRDSLITNYTHLIDALELPDKNDRHVLAAAIVGRCDIIVTQNLQDFPDTILDHHGIEVQHPDDFLCCVPDVEPGLFCSALKIIRNRLQSPQCTVSQYLANLNGCGLVGLVAELESFAALL